MMYKEISKCRFSGSKNLIHILSLGNMELTGVFPKTKDEKITKETVDPSNYSIKSWARGEGNKNHSIIISTDAETTLKVNLRWKNGSGLAYPCLSISLRK